MVKVYSIYDFIIFPVFVIILLVIVYSHERSSKGSKSVRKHIYYGFVMRAVFCLLYFLILQFYYHGYGDSASYWFASGALQNMDWSIKRDFLLNINSSVPYGSTLFYAFGDYNGFVMANASNAMVAKIAYLLSFLCGNSYLTLCLFFSFIAFMGCWQLFILFLKYYPTLEKELALSLLYLPSVCFFSSGVLKDPLTLGALGFFIANVHKVLIEKRQIVSGIIYVILSGAIMLIIKAYILLAIIPGLTMWIFSKYNFAKLNKQMRSFVTFVFIVVAGGLVAVLLQYFTSTEYAKQLATDNISDRITEMRNVYASDELAKGNSYFELGTTNPLLGFLLGIVASLFRPFIWETRSFNMFFSGVEALVFLLTTIHLFFKGGITRIIRSIFSNADTIFFFMFVMVFAGAVGSSTPNFGTLVRYKIPCLPFYLMMLFVLMQRNNIPYPGWLNKLLGKRPPKKKIYKSVSAIQHA